MEAPTLSLLDVSTKLGVSPSAIKKRVANLNLPVQRGARGKLIFDERAFGLLSQADELLKAGHGFEECRRMLGLDTALEAVVPEAPAEPDVAPVEEPVEEPVAAAPVAVEEAAPEASSEAFEPVADDAEPIAHEPVGTGSLSRVRELPPPVFIQLGKRKPMAEAVLPQSPQEAAQLSPEMIARLDRALKLIEEKEKQNQQLQAKLLVAYDEMTKLSATAAAFQERSLNLQHEVTKLQSELRLLTAPASDKPWWRFW